MASKTSTTKLTVNEALRKALKDATEPTKAKDVIERALPMTSLNTKTPKATIAHALSVEARKPDGLFERTGAGMYRLREQKAAPAVQRDAKPDPKAGGRKKVAA